ANYFGAARDVVTSLLPVDRMRSLHRFALVAAATVLACVALVVPGFVAQQVEPSLEVSGLAFAAILVSALAMPQSGASDGATMTPSFTLMFAVLLLFGRNAATVVAAACAITAAIVQWRLAYPIHRIATNIASVFATLAAAFVYQTITGAVNGFDWPWRVASIAAAVIAYVIVTTASTGLIL